LTIGDYFFKDPPILFSFEFVFNLTRMLNFSAGMKEF